MSRIISDLRGLVVPPNLVEQGTIVGVSIDAVSLSSSSGMKNFKVANPGAFIVGDKVRFQGELFIGKVDDEINTPHYSV